MEGSDVKVPTYAQKIKVQTGQRDGFIEVLAQAAYFCNSFVGTYARTLDLICGQI